MIDEKQVPHQVLVIAEGWHEAGKVGVRIGPDTFSGQQWTPILFDGEEDPTFHKSAGLRTLTSGEQIMRKKILELQSMIEEMENAQTKNERKV